MKSVDLSTQWALHLLKIHPILELASLSGGTYEVLAKS